MSFGRACAQLAAVTIATTVAAGAMTGCNLRLDSPKPRDPSNVESQLADAEAKLDAVARAQTTLLSPADFGPEWTAANAKGLDLYGAEPLTAMIECFNGATAPKDPKTPVTTSATPATAPNWTGIMGFGISPMFRLNNIAYAVSLAVETSGPDLNAKIDKVVGPGGTLSTCIASRLGTEPTVEQQSATSDMVTRWAITTVGADRGAPMPLNAALAVVHSGTSYVVLLNAQPAETGFPNPGNLIDVLSSRVVEAQSKLTQSTATSTTSTTVSP
ncbi:MAG: hypothetical protein AB7V43_00820 [Acidimicrobiia bacterium]